MNPSHDAPVAVSQWLHLHLTKVPHSQGESKSKSEPESTWPEIALVRHFAGSVRISLVLAVDLVLWVFDFGSVGFNRFWRRSCLSAPRMNVCVGFNCF